MKLFPNCVTKNISNQFFRLHQKKTIKQSQNRVTRLKKSCEFRALNVGIRLPTFNIYILQNNM
jgi:hypothetical protein